MRKTRLKILPARCLAMIGFILHYLACPLLAEMSRGQPDSGLASSLQLQVLQHCSSPPEDPGEGGCANRWKDQLMTRTISPNNGHDNICSSADVFQLENTCLVDHRPAGNTQGHPESATRYTRTSHRRLLAARSKDPSAVILKTQIPRRQIKYRSLKRRQVPEENLGAGSSQHRHRLSTRTLLAVQSSERTASGEIDNTRRALPTERNVPRRMAEKTVSQRTSEVEAMRRVSTERRSSSKTTPGRRSLAEADVTRGIPRERQAHQRTTMQRRTPEVYGSRRMLSDSQHSRQFSADHRASELDFSRISNERRSSPRKLTDRKIYASDTTSKLPGEQQFEGRMSTERRISVPHASRTSEKRGLSKRKLSEQTIIKFDQTRGVSTERQSSRRLTTSDSVSEERSGSRVSSERSFSESRHSHSSTLNSPQDDSRKTSLTRISSERAEVSWRFGSQQRSSSRRMQTEEGRINAQRSSSRRHGTGRSESQRVKKSFAEKTIDPDRTNTIRSTTRSISSRISHDRSDSRMLRSFRMTYRSSANGMPFEERQNVRISHKRLFHSTPSVQHLPSLYSKQKQNETQSSKSVSRILAHHRNVRTSNDRLSSRISYNHIEASAISTVPRTRLSPPQKSNDHITAFRIADNRINVISNERTSSRRAALNRISLNKHLSQENFASEEWHKIRLNRERQPLLSELSGHHASFRAAKERRLSPDRMSTIHSTLAISISEERINSRTSPTTYGLFGSERPVSGSPSDRRLHHAVSRQSSEFTASRTTSNERILMQWQKLLSRQTALRGGSIRRRFTGMPISRNRNVIESAKQQSLSRSSEERASALKNSRTMYAERLATLGGSKIISGEQLAKQRDSRSTERLAPLRNSRRVSVQRPTYERQSDSSVRESRTSTERLRSKKDSGSAERLADVSKSRIISTVQLTPKKVYSRSTEYLESMRNSKGISASLRHSRTSVGRLTIQRNSRSAERLTNLRDPRKTSTGNLEAQRYFRESFEHLTSVKDSRKISTERLATQRSTKQSQRFVPQIVSIRFSERVKPNRDSRIIAERETPTAASRRISAGILINVRDSRKTPTFSGSRKMLEGSTFVTRYRISPALLENARKSRISVEHLVSVKVSRRIFNEQLSNQRSPRYADHFVTSAGQLISERNSKRSVERLTHTRNSRISERLASDTDSRHSVERLTSRRDSIRIISERDFRYSVRLSASIRNFRTSAERLISYTESRHSFERFAPVRANRKTAHKGDSISSVEHLTSVRKSKISAERLASNRHLIDQLVSVRDFRRSTERNVRQSDGRLATMMDSRIYAEKLATKRDFRRFESLTSLKNAQRKPTEGASIVRNSRRTTVNQLRNSVRIAHERQSLYIKSSPDRLANRRLMSTAFNRLTRPISDRHVSQLKPISTIHITSKILNDHGIMRMSNVRNTGLPDGYISNNQTLDQGLRLSEKKFKATDNTTLKTESSTDIGLLFGSVQTSTLSPTQFSSWSDKAIEYTKCGLTTLTMMWPSIAIWKGETLKSLAGFNVISAFSSEMDHFNNFFADKPTSNYAHVPDDLAFFHSTKATPPVMRDRNRILPTVIRGGVTAAFMLLSTKSK